MTNGKQENPFVERKQRKLSTFSVSKIRDRGVQKIHNGAFLQNSAS